MSINFDNSKGKYICIYCYEDFKDVPDERLNECRTAIQHYIVKKDRLKKILIKRNVISV